MTTRRDVRGEPSAGERVPDQCRVRRRVVGHTVYRFRYRVVGDHARTVPGSGHGRNDGRRVPDRPVEGVSGPEKDQLHPE